MDIFLVVSLAQAGVVLQYPQNMGEGARHAADISITPITHRQSMIYKSILVGFYY